MEPSWIETINVPKCPKHNHGRMDHGLKCRINHGKVIVLLCVETFTRHAGPIRVSQLAVTTLAQKDHSQETGTQLTLLVNIMRHTTFTQSHL